MRTDVDPRSGTPPSDRRAVLLGAIVLAIVLGAPPRFASLRDAGPFAWDDGIHVLEGRWLETGAEALVRSGKRWLTERRTGEDTWRLEPELAALGDETQGMPLFFPRPGFAALVAVALHFTHGAVWAGALVSAVTGLATVALVTWLGCRLWGVRSGALSGAALALSGWHVAYSRMAFAEAASVLFASASMAVLLVDLGHEGNAEKRCGRCRLVAAGLLWGLAALVQDRLLPIALLPILLGYGLLRRGETRRLLALLDSAVAIGAPVALFQVLAELPYYVSMLALAHFDRALPFPTHIERLLKHFAQGAAISGVRPENLPTYPFLYARLLGPGLAIALVAGAVGAFRAGERRERALVLWLLLPIVPASLTAAGARYAAVTLPAAALLGGWALDPGHWPERLRARLGERASWILSAALIASSVPFAVAPIGWTSGHREAMNVVRDQGLRCVISTDPYVTAVYSDFDMGRARPPARSGDDLKAAWESGCAYYVVDALSAILRARDPGMNAVLSSFEEAIPDPATLPNPSTESILFPFEYNFSFPTTLAYLRGLERERAGTIRLYPVSALARAAAPPNGEAPTPSTETAPPSEAPTRRSTAQPYN